MRPLRLTALRSLVIATLLLPCLSAAQPVAQVAEPPWLQVEVVVFRQLDTALSGNERWPAQPALEYPPDIDFLIEPGSPAHAAALAERELAAALAAEDATLTDDTTTADGEPAELPRLRLRGSDLMLTDAAARIAGSRQYRLLAHHGWRQPAPAAGHAAQVLLTGGAANGEHFELEGFLSLRRSRFWHAEARLWLNDFPPPGTAPGEAAVVLPKIPKPRLPSLAAQDALAAVDVPDAVGAPVDAVTDLLAVEPPGPLRTVQLRAERRLNPGELSYLDHPLFGVLLMIRPYDPNAPLPAEAAPSLNSPPSPAAAQGAQ